MASKDRALFLITMIALCLLTSSLLPVYFKTFFVERTGNFKVISPAIAILLIAGLVAKKYWASRLILVGNGITIIVLGLIILFSGFKDYRWISFAFIMLLQFVSMIILESRELKNFLLDEDSRFDFL